MMTFKLLFRATFKRNTILWLTCVVLFNINIGFGQSPSFQSFINPVIPGDHPDPTLTRIGDYFYTTGSSFNPTPKIYRSSNLVHWEVIAQPVSSDWNVYGNNPGGGIWGGHLVLYNDTYWHYFGRGGGYMYFVTADDPAGPWSAPTRVNVPAGMSSLGVDNSLFIDDDTGKWYLLTKAGHSNNHIVELGLNGQPTGVVLNISWLNPEAQNYPYGWAEGPVMWKYKGYYYYSFAQHLVGDQYVMRADTLSANPDAWEIMNGNIFQGQRQTFNRPNHISPVVLLDDSTSWAIGHSYHQSGDWYAQGRQGLLHRVVYNQAGWPRIQFPTNSAEEAPKLPSSGIPWMVPKSDMFNTSILNPEWSFLGYTPKTTYSLTDRPGWLHLKPYQGSNTVIKNDGEHQYSLITRVDFEPENATHQAGLWIFNGPETHYVKVFSTKNSSGQNVLVFSFQNTRYEVINNIGSIVWLKLVRENNTMHGFYSANGAQWARIGQEINALALDTEQSQFNNFTGNQQGLYVNGKSAYFDLYVYRDAYTNISAQHPANNSGVSQFNDYLGDIRNNNWALYAGVEFGRETSSPNEITDTLPRSNFVKINASSASSGGIVEVWLDSIDTGTKVAEVVIENTGSLNTYETFMQSMEAINGRHDVYLRFVGEASTDLFRLKWFRFSDKEADDEIEIPLNQSASMQNPLYGPFLEQNYPNPFHSATSISFNLLESSEVSLKVFDLQGKAVASLIDGKTMSTGNHQILFDATNLNEGVYIYRLFTNSFTQSRKMVLVKQY